MAIPFPGNGGCTKQPLATLELRLSLARSLRPQIECLQLRRMYSPTWLV